MSNINCNDRTDAYFRNMQKYENDIDIRVRFLDKIFKAAIDHDYSLEEKVNVLKKLLSITNEEKDQNYKVLNLCYCYKLNNILGANLNVPIIKLENTLKADICFDRKLPNEVINILNEKKNKLTFKFAESKEPDVECLKLFNIEIPKDHFFY